MPTYFLQVVNADGEPVIAKMRPVKQRYGTLSVPILDGLCARLGWWRSKAAIRQALHDTIQSLKDEAAGH